MLTYRPKVKQANENAYTFLHRLFSGPLLYSREAHASDTYKQKHARRRDFQIGPAISQWRSKTCELGASAPFPSSSLPSLFPTLPSPTLPVPLLPSFPFPSLPFRPFSSLPLEVGPLKPSYGVWGSAVSSLTGSGAEPQPKSNLVHYNLKIRDLAVTILIILLRIS